MMSASSIIRYISHVILPFTREIVSPAYMYASMLLVCARAHVYVRNSCDQNKKKGKTY